MFYIETFNKPTQRLINKFYKLHKQNVSASAVDRIFVAYSEQSDQIIGVALLRNYGTGSAPTWLLRSVFVTQRMRKQGVAAAILEEITDCINDTIYTLCEPHLVPMYKRSGFDISKDCPAELTKLTSQKSLTLLVRLFVSQDGDLDDIHI